MTDEIERAVKASIAALAGDPKTHDELRALAIEGQLDFPEVKAAVEALLQGGVEGAGIGRALCDAFLNNLLDSDPFETIGFDSGGPGGGAQHHVYKLPNGEALVCSTGDGWKGPYESVGEAVDEFSISTIEIYYLDDPADFSKRISAVPEDVDRIQINDESYHRDDGMWCHDFGGPNYVLRRGTWMTEDEAMDVEDEYEDDP